MQRGCAVPTVDISGASFRISRTSVRKLIDRVSYHNHYCSSCPTAGSRSSQCVPCVRWLLGEKQSNVWHMWMHGMSSVEDKQIVTECGKLNVGLAITEMSVLYAFQGGRSGSRFWQVLLAVSFPTPPPTWGNSAAVNDFTLPLQALSFPETTKTEEKCCHIFQTAENMIYFMIYTYYFVHWWLKLTVVITVTCNFMLPWSITASLNFINISFFYTLNLQSFKVCFPFKARQMVLYEWDDSWVHIFNELS